MVTIVVIVLCFLECSICSVPAIDRTTKPVMAAGWSSCVFIIILIMTIEVPLRIFSRVATASKGRILFGNNFHFWHIFKGLYFIIDTFIIIKLKCKIAC